MEAITRKELIHTNPGMKQDDFLQAVDATGGWPNGFKFVSFYHAAEYEGRICRFSNSGINTGWWTVVCTADDYYWWKLSDAKKTEVVGIARRQLISQLR